MRSVRIAFALALLFLARAVSAQPTTVGSIQGVVLDQATDMPLTLVTVVAGGSGGVVALLSPQPHAHQAALAARRTHGPGAARIRPHLEQ